MKSLLYRQLALIPLIAFTAGCASFEEIRTRAANGDPSAQYSVGMAYAKGSEEVGKDVAAAEEYLKKAADNGHKHARRALFLLWMENSMLDHAEDIIAGYPAVAEKTFLSWSMDGNLLKAGPDFATALVKADKLEQGEKFAAMVLKLEEKMFYRGGHNCSFKSTNEGAELLRRIGDVARMIDARKNEIEINKREEARLAREAELKKAEELLKAKKEAERLAREKAEKDWLARKDDPAYKFPLRKEFGDSVKVYKDFSSGCSLEWATNYIARTLKTKPVVVTDAETCGWFMQVARHLEMQFSEKPAREPCKGPQTETSPFICNPENIVLAEDGHFVILTFGELPAGDGGTEKVLVGGEIDFRNDSVPCDALAGKYGREFGGEGKDELVQASETGVGAAVRCFSRRTGSGVVKIMSVQTVESRKEKEGRSITESVLENADGGANPYDAATGIATAEVAVALDLMFGAVKEQIKSENLQRWRGLKDKPIVSFIDIPLFSAMTAAKDKADLAIEEEKLAKKKASEEEKRKELENKLDSL